MVLLSLIAALLVGASVALVARAVALPRLKAADRVRDISAYGFNASLPAAGLRGGAANGPAFADLASRIGALLGSRLKSFHPDALRRDLQAAGIYRSSPQALLGYRVLAAVALGAFGAAYLSSRSPSLIILGTVGFAGIGWVVPLHLVRRRGRARTERIDRDLPDLIDLLVVTIEAGMGLAAALQLASGKFDGPLDDELKLTLQQQRMGRSLGEALEEMLNRVDTPAMRSFVRSVTQGEKLGVAIGTIMRNLAAEMRKRRRASAEEQAQKAPVKMLFPLVFLILPALLVVILGPAVFSIGEALGG